MNTTLRYVGYRIRGEILESPISPIIKLVIIMRNIIS